ncbi:MAG: HD domain-containing protein [Bacteroidetes bacterium]|nr:HD domain-containing protein [Bacteroidota bacterium]
MNTIDASLLEEAANYARNYLEENLPENLFFHSPDHTFYVVNAANEIGAKSDLSHEDLNLVLFCAWFHDLGYSKTYMNHEEQSIAIATSFLEKKGADQELIRHVAEIIMATKIPQDPRDEVAKVLCDADLKHLSEVNYYDFAEKIRQEQKSVENRKISKLDFDLLSEAFFKQHHYHTDYGKKVLSKGKEKNFEMIQHNITKRQKKMDQQLNEKNKELEKLQKKLEKKKGYSRGVESMFRLTARNQINLSSIADNKSNILISVNTIIISILLSVLVSRFSEFPNIILPTLVFLLFSLITIIFAILSTRPNISSGIFTKEDIKQKNVNLLFFGNFYNMSLEDYEWGLEEMMRDDDYLYATMIKDQYFLGKVLAKKYKLLRIAYNFFMFGLIISVAAYVLAFTNL